MTHQGRLTEWNDERGIGFMTSFDGGSSAFFSYQPIHSKSTPAEVERPSRLLHRIRQARKSSGQRNLVPNPRAQQTLGVEAASGCAPRGMAWWFYRTAQAATQDNQAALPLHLLVHGCAELPRARVYFVIYLRRTMISSPSSHLRCRPHPKLSAPQAES